MVLLKPAYMHVNQLSKEYEKQVLKFLNQTTRLTSSENQ